MKFNAETELTVTEKSCPVIKMLCLYNSLSENQKKSGYIQENPQNDNLLIKLTITIY